MTARRLTVLILGGYGTFGGRLAFLLAPNPGLDLIIAGRSIEKAEAFIATLPAGALRTARSIDRGSGLAAAFAAERPDILVDATGPFQAYGPDPYAVVRAAIDAKINYIDLADGSDFVEGIGQFDRSAATTGIFVLAGASSFPVLTSAVVRALGDDMETIDSVAGGIAPSPYAGVGLNVIRAITGYAGQRIRIVRGGEASTAFALTETRRYTIAPPGRLPLRNTRFSLVDVPDLVLIPRDLPSVRDMWMGAGPVPEILHRALNLFAWAVRLRLLPTIAPLAGLCYWAINIFRWGEHRGGMFVELSGTTRDGHEARRSWHMLAEGDDGPLIPSMAVAIVVEKMLEGIVPVAGARAATRELELADYERAFADRAIFTGRRDDSASRRMPLYRQLLGQAWDSLPRSIRQMHDIDGRVVAEGLADVETGAGYRASLIRRLVGFPQAGRNVPVSVTFDVVGGIEIWTRSFAGVTFSSKHSPGRGRDDRLVIERFGPVRVSLAVIIAHGQLSLIVRRWSLFGLPLPLGLAPRSEAQELEANGRFNFRVAISHPWVGLIVRYRGWLGDPGLSTV